MRAAIYARKSTAQNDVAEEAKSVTRQIDGARAFILKQGWTLDDTHIGTKQVKGPDGKPADRPVFRHIYEDDGISGALFMGRPEFQRMMADARVGAFDAVVFYDLDRLGRHAQKTMDALYELDDLEIEIWDYSTGRSLDLESFEGEMMTFFRARSGQHEQYQRRKNGRDSARRKAEQGYVAGGKVFGYDNVRIAKGQAKRVVNDAEAAVVRDIFERCARGEGLRTIAAALNRAGALKPRAQGGRKDGWSFSTVREVLKRPLYRGEIIYGRTATVWGRELGKNGIGKDGSPREKAQLPTPEDQWIRMRDESLRIIDPDLEAAVDARLKHRRTSYEKQNGARAPEKAHGKYLLSGGMLVCPSCEGHFEAIVTPWHPEGYYACATRRRKPGICENTLRLPIPYADSVVLDMVEGEILSLNFIEELLALVDKGEDDNTALLLADRDRLRKGVENLVASIAAGVPPASIAPTIREHEAEIARIEAKLRQPRPERPNIDALRDALTQRAAEWRQTLRAASNVPAARVLLRRLIEPLVLTDESTRPEWVKADAAAKLGLLEGIQPVGSGHVLPDTQVAFHSGHIGDTLPCKGGVSCRGGSVTSWTTGSGLWRGGSMGRRWPRSARNSASLARPATKSSSATRTRESRGSPIAADARIGTPISCR